MIWCMLGIAGHKPVHLQWLACADMWSKFCGITCGLTASGGFLSKLLESHPPTKQAASMWQQARAPWDSTSKDLTCHSGQHRKPADLLHGALTLLEHAEAAS